MIKVFIDGKEGTTGLQIFERLGKRTDVDVIALPDELRKDVAARKECINKADVVFLCLPDAAAKESVSLCERIGVKILDASTAHRTNPTWAYGFPELSASHREKIAHSDRIAVPGCHASGFISLVYPLIAGGLVEADYPFVCHSVTGYSGGGKKMIAEYEAPRENPALNAPRPYGLALHHKHLPEMKAITGLACAPNFVPIVADYYAGMETMIPLDLEALGLTARQVADTLAAYYAGARMISVHPLCEGTDGGFLAANKLAGSDRLEIFCLTNPEGTQMQLISLFDNLGKGSSGAAVQCMNLMRDWTNVRVWPCKRIDRGK